MSLRILSFFNEGVTWRIAQSSDGYYHRNISGMPDWLAGIPSEISLDMVESTFQQFSSQENAIQPSSLSFKLTYRVGQSNVDCFIFCSPEGDQFSVQVPPATFETLQGAFPSDPIPRMRVARLVVQEAIRLGLPDVELLPGTPLYEAVQSQVSKLFSQQAKR